MLTGESRQIVREGVISAVFPERHTCRVVFPDKDDLTSAELPVLTLCSAQNKFFSIPDVGTSVVCLFSGNADGTGTGFIIGSRFHDKSTPNADSIDKTRMDFGDGTFIEYDRSTHELKIKCAGKITIEASDEIDFKGAKSFTLTAQKAVNLTATDNIIAKGKRILLN